MRENKTNPVDEADFILRKLHELDLGLTVVPGDRVYPGLGIEGKKAILEMKDANYPFWKEMEWPSYYISFLLERELEGHMETIKDRKRIAFKGSFFWDIRLKSLGATSNWVILTDVRNIDKIFDLEPGFGLIIIFAMMNYEKDGSFRLWHDKLKGGSSDYTKKIEREGRKPRRRKISLFLIEGRAYFFSNLQNFQSGIQEQWLDNDFARTMRNANEQSRNPKYAINISKIPKKYKILDHNFNTDIEEFEDEIFFNEE